MRIWNGPSLATGGAGTCCMIASYSGVMSPSRTLSSRLAKPCSAEAYTIGKSSCSLVAPSLSNRSNTWSITQSGRAPGRSILLTTTIGRKPIANAFWVTKRVCGIGPSIASTRISTESTIDSTRSTSPPKSAWPGVSTMLMRLPCQVIAVFLARMVMPRSFSWSLLSITRSARTVRSLSVPDCFSRQSTRVVLPWSTWATMAMLRRRSTDIVAGLVEAAPAAGVGRQGAG